MYYSTILKYLVSADIHDFLHELLTSSDGSDDDDMGDVCDTADERSSQPRKRKDPASGVADRSIPSDCGTTNDSCSTDWTSVSDLEANVLSEFAAKDRCGRMGRPRYDELYPITSFIDEYISQCNPAAADEKRRRTTCFTTCTVKDITKYVRGRIRDHCRALGMPVPEPYMLPKETTVRRQGVAPNPKLKAAKLYTGNLNFRTAPRRCDVTRYNPDFHYSASDVKSLLEMSALCQGEVLFISCDNKNKLRIGAPANSNRARPRGMYLQENQPSRPDHSFPEQGVYIVPMGYMEVAVGRGRARHASMEDFRGFR